MKRITKHIVWAIVSLLVVSSVPIFTRSANPTARASQDSVSNLPYFHFQISGGTAYKKESPRVAYSYVAHEYLVVWHNDWNYTPDFYDISARRVSKTGELRTEFTVASGFDGDGINRMYPDVAANLIEASYLVVYMLDALQDGVHYEIWGRLVATDGSWKGSEFQIMAWPNRAFWQPRVAYSSAFNRYLVIASVKDTITNKWNDVAGRLVLYDGSMPYPGHAISTQNQTLQPREANLAYGYNSRAFLVVWQQTYVAGDDDIWGARVDDLTGNVINPPGIFFIDRASATQASPAVAGQGQPAAPSAADRFLVVWQHYVNLGSGWDNWDIWGRELDSLANPIGDRFPINDTPGTHDYRPAVALAPDRRFVTWEIFSPPFYGTIGSSVWNPFIQAKYLHGIASEGGRTDYPAIALGDPNCHLVVYSWTDYLNQVPHNIYGTLFMNAVYMPFIKR